MRVVSDQDGFSIVNVETLGSKMELTMRSIIVASAIAVLMSGVGFSAEAAQCRDAKGKFIKCAAAPMAQPTRCKDAKGKFAKCSAPGAVPVK